MVRDFLRWFLVGFCLGALFHLATLAHAQENNLAASYLAFCRDKVWPCGQSLRVFEGLPVKRVGWLAGTFGYGCSCPREFLGLSGAKYVRVHLANGTCFPERGRFCARGEPFFGETIASADRKLRRRRPDILRRYRRNLVSTKAVLSAADADTIVRLSLCLECPVSNKARLALLKTAREVFPDGVFVDSVLTQRCLSGLICERHGSRASHSAPCIADTDGEDFRSMNVARYRARASSCEAVYLWSSRFNLLDTRQSRFIPPLSRSTLPTRADFKALRRWLRH